MVFATLISISPIRSTDVTIDLNYHEKFTWQLKNNCKIFCLDTENSSLSFFFTTFHNGFLKTIVKYPSSISNFVVVKVGQ